MSGVGRSGSALMATLDRLIRCARSVPECRLIRTIVPCRLHWPSLWRVAALMYSLVRNCRLLRLRARLRRLVSSLRFDRSILLRFLLVRRRRLVRLLRLIGHSRLVRMLQAIWS